MDTSSIIYFKKDIEMDEDIEDGNACLPLFSKAKRFKQDEYSKVDHIAPEIKDTKLKSCKNRNKRYMSACRYLKESNNYNYNEVQL